MSVRHEIKLEAAHDAATELPLRALTPALQTELIRKLRLAYELGTDIPEDRPAPARIFKTRFFLKQAQELLLTELTPANSTQELRSLNRKIAEADAAVRSFGEELSAAASGN